MIGLPQRLRQLETLAKTTSARPGDAARYRHAAEGYGEATATVQAALLDVAAYWRAIGNDDAGDSLRMLAQSLGLASE